MMYYPNTNKTREIEPDCSRRNKRLTEMTLRKAMEIIASNPAVIFSHSYCPYCVSVKKLLTKLGASYKCVELDAECDGGELQLVVAELTGQRTVPNVFIGGRHIGGCDVCAGLCLQRKTSRPSPSAKRTLQFVSPKKSSTPPGIATSTTDDDALENMPVKKGKKRSSAIEYSF